MRKEPQPVPSDAVKPPPPPAPPKKHYPGTDYRPKLNSITPQQVRDFIALYTRDETVCNAFAVYHALITGVVVPKEIAKVNAQSKVGG